MMTSKSEKLIVNFLNNQASASEIDALALWIQDPHNEKIFNSFIKTNYAIDYNMKQFDTDQSKKQLLEMIRKEMKVIKMRSFQRTMKYAATILLVISLGYLYQQGFLSSTEVIKIDQENVTLQLDNGTIEVINEDGSKQIVNAQGNVVGQQNGNQLTYENETTSETLAYNELTVPKGKRFELILSDGTHVFLNAGTSMKYPVKFLKEFNRQVFLTGEAYFDVAKDAEHPFIVNAQDLNVQVLGTHFNVSAYPEDMNSEVVLVEGSVAMYQKDKTFDVQKDVVLKPGAMGAFNKSKETVVTKSVNTAIYTSWVHGDIVFRNTSFDNLVTKLERLYNVTIINNNKSIANQTFNASINVDKESIEEVLSYFQKVYQLEYKIVNNKIVIE